MPPNRHISHWPVVAIGHRVRGHCWAVTRSRDHRHHCRPRDLCADWAMPVCDGGADIVIHGDSGHADDFKATLKFAAEPYFPPILPALGRSCANPDNVLFPS
jgi:hypothetical protein